MASKPKGARLGRPPTISPKGSHPLTVRLPRDYYEALLKEAVRRKKKAGDVLRERLGLT